MATQICNLHGFNDINGGAHPSIKNFFNEILDKIKIQVDETYTGNNIILDTTWIHPSQINLVKFKTIYDSHFNSIKTKMLDFKNVNNLFLVQFLDPMTYITNIDDAPILDEIIDFINPINDVYTIPYDTVFQFWGMFSNKVFQKYKNLNLPWTGKNTYLCYNRKPHPHRIQLIDTLSKIDSNAQGIYTLGQEKFNTNMGGSYIANEVVQTIPENNNFNYDPFFEETRKESIPHDTMSLGNHDVWQKCLVNIISETDILDEIPFLTEKTWKPIVGKRPFIILGTVGCIKILKQLGFKTFDSYWDESYDTMSDLTDVIEHITTIIRDINNMSHKDRLDMYHHMTDILEYNHNFFFNEFHLQNSNRLNTIIEDTYVS